MGRAKEGFALFGVLLVLVLLSTLSIASLLATSEERMASGAMHGSAKAFYAAESGVNAVIASWNEEGYASQLPAPGDSFDLGWRTLENGCRYRALIRRVDGGSGPRVYSVRVTGRSVPALDSQRSLLVVLRSPAPLPRQAVAVGSSLRLAGQPSALDACGTVHANGPIQIDSLLTVSVGVSSTDTVIVGGSVVDSAGNPVVPQSRADSVEIPQLDPADFCGQADYRLRNGWIVRTGSPADSTFIGSAEADGWRWNSGTDTYELDATQAVPGTACVEGNVAVNGNLGTSSSPLSMSILASGSVDVSGSPFIAPDHPEDILILAGGDLRLNGESGAAANYAGLLYAGSQCEVRGMPLIRGQLICRGDPDPAGATPVVAENVIGDGVKTRFDCGAFLDATVRPLTERAWAQFMN